MLGGYAFLLYFRRSWCKFVVCVPVHVYVMCLYLRMSMCMSVCVFVCVCVSYMHKCSEGFTSVAFPTPSSLCREMLNYRVNVFNICDGSEFLVSHT